MKTKNQNENLDKGLSSTSYHDLQEDDLTCAICLEILHRPRVLPCTHAFCLICLQNYVNTCRSLFTCPSCRGKVELPPQGVLGLDQDKELTEAAQKFRQKISDQVYCQSCQKTENLTSCSHCDTFWCKNCIEYHTNDILKDIQILQEHLITAKDNFQYQDIKELNEIKCQWETGLKKLSIKIQDVFCNHNTDFQMLHDLFLELIKLSKSPILPKGTKIFWKKQLPFEEDNNQIESNDDIDLDIGNDSEDNALLYRKKSYLAKSRWSNNLVNRMAGIAFCPSTSNIYVAGSDTCKILVLSEDGKLLTSWGSRGHGEGQFLCPTGIAFSQVTQELLITDKWRHCIYVYDLVGNFIRQLGRKGKSFGHFISPEGIATDKHGRIYVADTCNNRVQVLDSDGIFLKELGVISTLTLNDGIRYNKTELNEPTGVAVSPDGAKVYIADAGNNRVKVYDVETGQRLMVLGSKGLNKGQFDSPECVAVDPKGFILVGDSGNGRIQIFSPEGRFVRYLGTKNSNCHGEFGWVASVALSKKYQIVVTDFKDSVIGVY